MALTHEDLEILKRPFELDEHEFHQGNVYLRENAICNRFDEVDPSWSNDIINTHSRPTTDGKLMSVCLMRVTIKGVFRDGIGQASVVTKKDSSFETNEPEKSAATDAIKRAARLFGVGRYLLDARGVNDMNGLAQWLKGEPLTSKGNSTPKSNVPASKGKLSERGNAKRLTYRDSPDDLKRFKAWTQAQHISDELLVDMLNLTSIDGLLDLPCDDAGKADIVAAINNYKARVS